MSFVTIPVLILLSLIILRLLVAKVHRNIIKKTAIRRGGCETPRRYAHKDPRGQDLYNRSIEAYKQRRFLDFEEELYEQYGTTFETISGGKVWIKSKDPEVSKAIYSTFFDKFGLQPIRYEDCGFFGHGILVMDGEFWKRSRSMIRPAFEVAHIANFDRLYRHVSRFIDIIPDDGSTVDLLPLFKRLVSAFNPATGFYILTHIL